MPANFTYPGVYITEQPSGAQAVPAAATSVALFIGMLDRGPFDTPTRVQSQAEFSRLFGETAKGEMALQVGQFFVNGGGDAYVMRIAQGGDFAKITLCSETATPVLELTARDKGLSGNQICVEIDYNTASPERSFNLIAYRSVAGRTGMVRQEVESFANLTMNPSDPRFVETVLGNTSALLTAKSVATAGTAGGASIGGYFFDPAANKGRDQVFALIKPTVSPPPVRTLRISIAGRIPVTATIDNSSLVVGTMTNSIEAAIISAYQSIATIPAASLKVQFTTIASFGTVMEITSTEGAVVVTPAGAGDIAVPLMLGEASGGVELDNFSVLRPAPSGFSTRAIAASGTPGLAWLSKLTTFAALLRKDFNKVTFTDPTSTDSPYFDALTLSGNSGATDKIMQDTVSGASDVKGSFAAIRRALDEIAAKVSTKTAPRWTGSRMGLRISMRPDPALTPAIGVTATLTTETPDIGAGTSIAAGGANSGAYTLGATITGSSLSVSPVPGMDGNEPTITEYKAAFATVESQVEIFNMMLLPRAPGQDNVERKALWGPASSFCAAQRAILFVDPPDNWATIANAEAGASDIKVGVDTRNSVIYWPRLKVPTPDVPSGVPIDASGSMAGLYARTDTRFGTWRAPAGIEATLTGVVGLEKLMSDAEHGRLNPKALNVIRLFPSGITSWGARTMVGSDDTGNMDDKYVNVRRMMLFIENSLYRGLRFAVFRNNAEPLWASIRLAAGSFMQGLMTQGAFASQTKSEAYYVRCDSSTTTANDINLGIVNVLVGFAPNKPAEFVHLTVTQIAGQSDA